MRRLMKRFICFHQREYWNQVKNVWSANLKRPYTDSRSRMAKNTHHSVHRLTWVPQIRSQSLNFLSTERRGAHDNCGGMAVTSKRASDIMKFNGEIQKYFAIADGGEIRWFLGFEIKGDRAVRTISVNQRSYIERMVERFRLTNVK